MADEFRKAVRRRLVEADLTLAWVVRRSPDLDYLRIERILLGRAAPLPGEIDALIAAVDRAAVAHGPRAPQA